ncbi:hypothetical protein QBC39DRAFT_32616 [Podospora conica]|nr:hypothetical protein QBC39DRAFT_32616 [Schizothecium conicum]
MSVFSMLRRGRQAAKEQSTKQAKEPKQEPAKPRYRHIPKHAAIDALSSGPPSHRESDRPRIQEQNRIRSSLTASGIGMTGTGSTGSFSPLHHTPRTGSSLSCVSYPSPAATPIVRDGSSSSASSSQDESSSSPAISLRSGPRRKMSRRASEASLITRSFRPASSAMIHPGTGPTVSQLPYSAAYIDIPARKPVAAHLNGRSMHTEKEVDTTLSGWALPAYSGWGTPSLVPPQELEAEPLESPVYRSGVRERRRRSTIISGLPMEFDNAFLPPPTQELVVPAQVVAGGGMRKGMWSMKGGRRRGVEV